MRHIISVVLVSALVVSAGGCGYTTSSLLPPELNSIHVNNFQNKIDPTREVSDQRMSYTYRPGMDTQITRAVIDGFIFDRRLDIKSSEKAVLILDGELIDYKLYPLSYNRGGDVEEFRIEVIVNMSLRNRRTGELLWVENNFSGQTDYKVVGPNAQTEEQAIQAAVKDLAQRVVERVVENW